MRFDDDDDDFEGYAGDNEDSWEDTYEGGNPDDWDGGDWQDAVRKKSARRRDPEDELHDAGLDSDFDDEDDEDDLFEDDDLLGDDDLDENDPW